MPDPFPENVRLIYVVDPAARSHAEGLCVEVTTETVTPGHASPDSPPLRLSADAWLAAPDPADRDIARLLLGPRIDEYRSGRTPMTSSFMLRDRAFDTTLAAICATGRCHLQLSASDRQRKAAGWDAGEPWRLELRVHRDETGAGILSGALSRDDETMALSTPLVLHPSGVLYVDDTFARFDHGGAFMIAATLRAVPRVPLAEGELPDLLETLYALPHPPVIALPDDISIAEQQGSPRPWLSITPDPSPWRKPPPALVLGFQYGTVRIQSDHPHETVFDKGHLTLYRRDREAEREARNRLMASGAREPLDFTPNSARLTIPKNKLAPLVVELVREGWGLDASRHPIPHAGCDARRGAFGYRLVRSRLGGGI